MVYDRAKLEEEPTQDIDMRDILFARHTLLKTVRDFFYSRDYLEVETPNLMKTAPPDPFIEPLTAFSGRKGPFFLHTSPELGMKKLLPFCPNIFQICKTYRVEEFEEVHNTEFTMLEWYMAGTYENAMAETVRLVSFLVDRMSTHGPEYLKNPCESFSLENIFLERTGVNPMDMNRIDLLSAMKAKGFRVCDAEAWDELFFLLYVQEVEPWLHGRDMVILRDWPTGLSSMAKRKDEHRVERFELYVRGLEVANGYTELLDPGEQMERFLEDNRERATQGKPILPPDPDLLAALPGIDGPVAGVSVGLDRMLMILLQKERIEEVMPYRVRV